MKRAFVLLAAMAASCDRAGPRAGVGPTSAAISGIDAAGGGSASLAAASQPSTAPATGALAQTFDESVVLLTDAAMMTELESHGASFGEIAFGTSADSTRALGRDPAYHSLTAQIASDLAAERASDPQSGVGMRYAHRLFDARWLESNDTRFELTGVVNRMDRRPFHPSACGETRLVYRLAYRTDRGGHPIESRLPMTVNVVFWQAPDPDGACRTTALRWQKKGTALAGADGPLDPSRLGLDHLKSIETNVQTVRWPSTVRPDMAGHTEYALRVFHLDRRAHRLIAAPLENTPDVARLRKNAPLRAALLEWLRRSDTLRALDAGIAVMPDEWAATKSVSVTPRGLSRRANRPFGRLVAPSDLAGLDLTGYRHIRSPEALMRRLDEMSCAGCHQTRSLAGFHLLGEERHADKLVDALLVPVSPHLDGDLERRHAYVRAVLDGATPDDARPLADHERSLGTYGSHCGLGDPGFVAWTCSEGLACVDVGEGEVGACLPARPAGAGDPCEIGRTVADDDPRKDRVASSGTLTCPRLGSCFTNFGGFPNGMCALACGTADADSECGKIAILRDFNACLARGAPFDTCVRDNADPAAMRACDRGHACRDDYICARASAARGVCIPPYFLFQLRVDGHLL